MTIISTRCPQCGTKFEMEYDDGGNSYFAEIYKNAINRILCQKCTDAEDEQRHIAALEARESMIMQDATDAGIPPAMQAMASPANAEYAQWLHDNRNRQIVITGQTGAGKTTTMCWELMQIIRHDWRTSRYNHSRIRYICFPELLDIYLECKFNEAKGTREFWRYLDGYDYIAIDELAGKHRNSEFSAELLFALADRLYNGEFKARGVWLAGLLTNATLTNMSEAAEEIRRRLKESCVCVYFNNGEIRQISSARK